MATLKCSDLGMDCDHVITGNSVDEIKDKAFAHAREKHAAILQTMSSPQQMSQMEQLIEQKIQE